LLSQLRGLEVSEMATLKVLTLASGLAVAWAGGVELSPKNFDSSIEGKDAIIKFQAPW